MVNSPIAQLCATKDAIFAMGNGGLVSVRPQIFSPVGKERALGESQAPAWKAGYAGGPSRQYALKNFLELLRSAPQIQKLSQREIDPTVLPHAPPANACTPHTLTHGRMPRGTEAPPHLLCVGPFFQIPNFFPCVPKLF